MKHGNFNNLLQYLSVMQHDKVQNTIHIGNRLPNLDRGQHHQQMLVRLLTSLVSVMKKKHTVARLTTLYRTLRKSVIRI